MLYWTKGAHGILLYKKDRKVYLEIIHLVRTENFAKNQYFWPSDTHTCACQGVRNVSFEKILRTY